MRYTLGGGRDRRGYPRTKRLLPELQRHREALPPVTRPARRDWVRWGDGLELRGRLHHPPPPLPARVTRGRGVRRPIGPNDLCVGARYPLSPNTLLQEAAARSRNLLQRQEVERLTTRHRLTPKYLLPLTTDQDKLTRDV